MRLVIFTYHYFHAETPYGIPRHDFRYSLSADRFREHCEALARSGYEIIRPDRILEKLEDTTDQRGLAVTIDDGHDSVERIAFDILMQSGIAAVVNVVPGRVGQQHYLTWSSLRNLATHGFSIESHSMYHRNLTHLGRHELASDVESARKTIEDNVGTPVTFLTAPMGRVNSRVVRAARDAGYRGVMTSFTGENRGPGDAWNLKRFQVKSDSRPERLDRYFSPGSRVRLAGGTKNLMRRFFIGLGR